MKKIDKPLNIAIQEERAKQRAVLFQILKDKINEIPAHSTKEVKILSIEPTLRGIYVIWSECGTLQHFARTFEYKEMDELTKEFQ